MKLANWARNDLAEIKAAFVEFITSIDWLALLGALIAAIATAGFMALPFLTD